MGTILEDIDTAAEWIARALQSSGYVADFAPQSLWEIERFFKENSKNGKAVPGGLLAQDLGSRLFALGSYVGEVVRRAQGGEWHANDDDPQAEINVELRTAEGGTIWPVQRMMKRFRNGEGDSIAAYGIGLGLDIGEKPKQRKSGFWCRLAGS
jgi:hypothetical protein